MSIHKQQLDQNIQLIKKKKAFLEAMFVTFKQLFKQSLLTDKQSLDTKVVHWQNTHRMQCLGTG